MPKIIPHYIVRADGHKGFLNEYEDRNDAMEFAGRLIAQGYKSVVVYHTVCRLVPTPSYDIEYLDD